MIQVRILTALSRFTDGEVIPGNFGVLIPPVDVDLYPQSIIQIFQLKSIVLIQVIHKPLKSTFEE